MQTESPVGAKQKSHKAGITVLVAGAVLCALLLAAGAVPRLRRVERTHAVAEAAVSDLPPVSVVQPRRLPGTARLTLPGNTEAIQVASVFARSNGYIKRRTADIGDRVRAGQLLAELESPELDQEIRQAQATLEQVRAALGQKRAALEQARANLNLAGITLERWKQLVAQGVFAAQAGDERQGAYDARKADVEAANADIRAAEANVRAQEANISRLRELKGFARVTAPFDGVVTVRNVEAGDLVTSGSSTSVREMYKVARLDTLRTFVNVPQTQAPAIRTGLAAAVTVQEFQGRSFGGRVTRTANALDPASRTLLTEIQVGNPGGVLLPGMYARVEFELASGSRLAIPATVLVVRSDGSYAVAAVSAEGKVGFLPIRTGTDYGAETEVVSGLEGSEQLVVNPSDDLVDGASVRVVNARK